ncbi:MAG: exodeoxyribonuclease VII large subunit [Bacteroidales bacterium]
MERREKEMSSSEDKMYENEQAISLSELLLAVADTVNQSFSESCWIRAEISQIKTNNSGHCYLNLIEHDSDKSAIIANVRAIIWASNWRIMRQYFQEKTDRDLESGMNVMINVRVQLSEKYGLSLIIDDIDPSYTLGEIEAERLRVIKQLEEEGMMDMNSMLVMPSFPRRFAVIASETSAGYRDFIKQLKNYKNVYSLHTQLFHSLVQGKDAPTAIISVLDEINSMIETADDEGKEPIFDAVVIIRGGGAVTDMICFDDYELCANIAQFPIPIIVGVGHDHDYHIADMVAAVSVKTPTAAADYIINIFQEKEATLMAIAHRLKSAVYHRFSEERDILNSYKYKMNQDYRNRLADANAYLVSLESRLVNGQPEKILEKGYSIVVKNGKKIASIKDVKEGEVLKIYMKDGAIEVVVKKVK